MTTRALTPLLRQAPRHHLFTATRSLSSTTIHRQSNPFGSFNSPAPPRLSKEEQEIFEELQRQSTGAFSTPRAPPKINQSPQSTISEANQAHAETELRAEKMGEAGQQRNFQDEFSKAIEARGKGEELHPNVRRGAKPEFEGDINPKTGEVGGPKNEPLRWGAVGEWSYNGRTTDF